MSFRSLKSVDTSDLLNIQGLTVEVKPQQHGKDDSHSACKKEIEKLKRELSAEKSNCRKLKTSLSDAKQSHEDTKSSHNDALSLTKKEHKEEIHRLESKHAEILICLNEKHEEEIQSLKSKHEIELNSERKKVEETLNKKLIEQTEKYENIITSKEEQIQNLKEKVAESLELNSVERHKQIDELMKELNAVSEEAAYLKGVIQNFNKQTCQKCSFYENKCKEMAIEMATRNENFKALVEVCSKMESQLSQQDDLCILLANLKKLS